MKELSSILFRDNAIASLDGFPESLKSLAYLNLRSGLNVLSLADAGSRKNNITSVDELLKLTKLPNLRAIVLTENPCHDAEEFRMEVLVRLPKLDRIDKEPVSDEEREAADNVSRSRFDGMSDCHDRSGRNARQRK